MVISFLRKKNLYKLYKNDIIVFKTLIVTQCIVFKNYIIRNFLIRSKYN